MNPGTYIMLVLSSIIVLIATAGLYQTWTDCSNDRALWVGTAAGSLVLIGVAVLDTYLR